MKPFSFIFLFIINVLLSSALTPADSAVIRSSVVSYKMVNLKSGEVVADVNSSMAATPASVTKLITTATVLELLGADYRFPTYLETDGYISNDTLFGNLIIRGTGDPTFGSSFCGSKAIVDSVVNVIIQKGVKVICGDVIADASCFSRNPVPDKWVWEDLGFNYGAGSYGINIFDNTALVLFNSDKNCAYISRIINDLPGMDNVNDVKVNRIIPENLLAYCAPYSNKRLFYGSLIPNRKNIPLKVSTSNPPLVAAYKLYTSLARFGVDVIGVPREVILSSSGKVSLGKPVATSNFKEGNGSLLHHNVSKICSPYDTAYTDIYSFDNHTILNTFYSAPLKEIIAVTNFKSNNLYAESIFRHLALLSVNHNATSAQSIDTIRGFWTQHGVDVSFMRIYDGCGLSPQGALPASTIVDMLAYMYKSDNYSVFRASLPLAGKEGTVAKFLRNTPLYGKAWVKSGSLSGTRAYAGYISVNGNDYAFAVMFNNFAVPSKEVVKIIEEWLVLDAK
ncbi:MAG: D-alanyl-D-alanine carboxypeptidase/D-alanyl-D-alanine-endopeptidase [Candidatus Aphodosoma sp.]